jgi:ribonuclease-3
MGFWNNYFKSNKSIQQDSLKNINAVQNIIGYTFRNQSLLALALTHRSFNRVHDNDQPSNERLEYLGDSVLGLVIADRLFRDHPELREGRLTQLKAMLVNEITLADIGKQVGLNNYILLSPEEEKLGGRDRNSIISDAFESIIGAVYLDGGFESASDMVLRLIYTRKESIITDESQKNYKGDLLEFTQARGDGLPRYEVDSEVGPDHAKEFHISVYISNKKIGSGFGYSKKEAEQKAAAMALEELSKDN